MGCRPRFKISSPPGCWPIPLLFLLLAVVLPTLSAVGQPQISDLRHEYQFGIQITFQANLQADAPPEEALLFIQIEGDGDTQEVRISPDPDGKMVYHLDVAGQPIRAFSTITYWFEVRLPGGETTTSEKSSFDYTDNRFDWQVREGQPFRVHWYEGGADFAQNVQDTAQMGLNRIQSFLPLKAPDQVEIYIYSTAAEMQTTLSLASQNWVAAGHADPHLGVIVVTLPPGPDQRLLMEQRIPHELMHILLFQNMGEAYANLPAWLNEGLASDVELYPNPDYLILLNSAEKAGNLISISTLCKTFPNDAPSALLAYAEATSFTRYLHQQFGTSGLEKLLNQYRDGVDCERGVQVALGSDLVQLEKSWRQEIFSENLVLTAGKRLLPWLVLLVAVLAVPVSMTLVSLRRRPAG